MTQNQADARKPILASVVLQKLQDAAPADVDLRLVWDVLHGAKPIRLSV